MAVITVSNTGGNWNATTTWVGGVVPSPTLDTVAFTATSGNLTVNVASTCIGIDFTNYVNTITFTALLSINGAVNLGTGGYTQAGASGIQVGVTATLTSGGVTWSRLWTFSGGGIFTLADNWNFTGTLNFSNTGGLVINGNTINTSNLTSTTLQTVSGTTNIVFNGTGTWSNTSTGAVRNNITINTIGTLTISGNVYYNTGTLTYISGTVVSTGSVLNISLATTFNTSGMTWRDVAISNGTQSLTSNFNSEILRINSSGNVVINNSGGNIFISTLIHNSTFVVSGTASINLIGTGTWIHTSTGAIRSNLNINTSGILTIAANIYYNTGTLTYIAGIVDTTTNNSTLNISTTTLNTSGMSWNNIVYTGGTTTITLSSNLVFIGTFTITGSNLTTITLAGVGIIDSPNGTLQLTVSGANLALTTSATHNILNYQFNAEGYSVNSSGTWNVYGNLIRNGTGNGRSSTGTINFIGTGSILFNGGSNGAFVGIWNINTSGTLTFGSATFPNVYSECSIITYISGTVDASNCNLLMGFTVTLQTFTLNTSPINWKNITLRGANTLLLTSDLNLIGDLTTQIGTITINGLFNVNVGGNLTTSVIVLGTSTIVLNGTGLWTAPNSSTTFRTPIIINTNGIITLANTLDCGGNLTYIKGNVKANNTTISFFANVTLINLHKLVFKNITIGSGQTITMNEFFSGSPSVVTNIISNGANYTIVFQDGFEKIAKFVNISNCTLSKPLQLLVLTKSKRRSTNTGIRYINQSPNGIAKGEPSVNVPMTFGAGGLLPDPINL